MNLALGGIVNAKLRKLLDARFIYPISESEWVSPLVIIPKKGGKWRVCVDYRELSIANRKDHFPLTFIDQVELFSREEVLFIPRWFQWL